MLHNFITGINYAKLIQMQANQESFAPHAISRKAQLKIENKKTMAKVNTSRLQMPTKERKIKKKPKVKVLSRQKEKDLLLAVEGGRKHV